MPSSNFLQWDPPLANADSDGAYAADSSRAGGAPVNGLFPSSLANKLFYQLSTMVKAIADYMVGQGQNASDANEAVLSANFGAAIANQIAAGTAAAIVNVPFAATPVFNAAQGINFEMTLTGNVTSSTLINTTPGQRIVFIIHQDGSGGRTFAWPSNVMGAGVVDPGAGNTSVQEFIIDSAGNARPIDVMTVS